MLPSATAMTRSSSEAVTAITASLLTEAAGAGKEENMRIMTGAVAGAGAGKDMKGKSMAGAVGKETGAMVIAMDMVTMGNMKADVVTAEGTELPDSR
jgi:hypothetical protein